MADLAPKMYCTTCGSPRRQPTSAAIVEPCPCGGRVWSSLPGAYGGGWQASGSVDVTFSPISRRDRRRPAARFRVIKGGGGGGTPPPPPA